MQGRSTTGRLPAAAGRGTAYAPHARTACIQAPTSTAPCAAAAAHARAHTTQACVPFSKSAAPACKRHQRVTCQSPDHSLWAAQLRIRGRAREAYACSQPRGMRTHVWHNPRGAGRRAVSERSKMEHDACAAPNADTCAQIYKRHRLASRVQSCWQKPRKAVHARAESSTRAPTTHTSRHDLAEPCTPVAAAPPHQHSIKRGSLVLLMLATRPTWCMLACMYLRAVSYMQPSGRLRPW